MKKIFSLSLLFSLILTFVIPISSLATHSDPFREYFEPFYNAEYTSYHIKNLEGLDITASFLAKTYDWYLNENWDAINQYFNENVSEVSKINSNIQTRSILGNELPKSTTISYIVLRDVENSGHPFFNGSRIRVFYDLTYELYYDEDTHRVIRALAPRMSHQTYEFVFYDPDLPDMYREAILSCSLVSSNAVISSGQSSVNFSHSFKVYLTTTEGGNYTSCYGTISNNYTMNV